MRRIDNPMRSYESECQSRAGVQAYPRGMRRALAAILACVALATTTQSVSAQSSDAGTSENPRAIYEEGEALESQRLFLKALTKYQRSYDLSKNFGMLFVIGRVKEKLTDYVGALVAYEQYALAEEVKAKRDVAHARIEALKAAVATVSFSVTVEDTEVAIDGRVVGRAPFTKPLLLNPGTYEVVGKKQGYLTQRKTVQLSVGERLVLRFDMVAEQPAVPPPGASGWLTEQPMPKPPKDSTWMWVGWSSTLALAVGAGTFGALSLAANKELANARTAAPASQGNLDSLSSRVRTYSIAADVLMGATLAAAGLGLYLTLRPSTESKTALLVGPTGVSFTGTFR
jgi:hypothetical protein